MAAEREVILPDIMAANGVIHGIDGVIMDVTGGDSHMDIHAHEEEAAPAAAAAAGADADAAVVDNIPAVLTDYPGGIFSTLLAAVTAADLAAALDSEGPFTVFAPTNEAFATFLAAAGPDTKPYTSSPLNFPRVPETFILSSRYSRGAGRKPGASSYTLTRLSPLSSISRYSLFSFDLATNDIFSLPYVTVKLSC